MRRLFTLFSILLTGGSYSLSGQQLNLAQLQLLCHKDDFTDVNRYLANRGWEYYDSDRSEGPNYNVITWSHGKERWSDKASAWIHLYTYEGAPSKLAYESPNQNWFQAIDGQVARNGYKRIGAEILDGVIKREYSSANFLLTLSEQQYNDSDYYGVTNTSYQVLIVEKGTIYDPSNGPFIVRHDNGLIEMTGELVEGELDGEIRLYREDGSLKKVTHFRRGKRNGSEKVYSSDGTLTLEEEYRNDELHGVRKVYGPDGSLVDMATYSQGELNGPFEKLILDEQLYRIVGSNKDGEEHGLIKIYRDDVLRREMILSAGVKDGLYREYDSLGRLTLDGYQKGDGLEGPTTFFFPDDSLRIEGNFHKDLHEGQWKVFFDDRLIEIKHYQANQLHGEQIVYYRDTFAVHYRGYYADSQRVGEWVYYRYFQDGKGPLLYKRENYQNGKLHGPFYEHQFISVDFANYQRGQLHGPFARYSDMQFYFRNPEMSKDSLRPAEIGAYHHGKKHGDWVIYSVHGLLQEKGTYRQGKREGVWQEYVSFPEAPDVGRLHKTITYHDDKFSGPFEYIRPWNLHMVACDPASEPDISGLCWQWVQSELTTQGNYLKGELHGQYQRTQPDGLVLTQGRYSHGKREGLWRDLDTVGTDPVYLISTYESDVQNGPYREEFLQGGLRLQGQMQKDKMHGLWKFYSDENGHLHRTSEYQRGQLHGTTTIYDQRGSGIRFEVTVEKGKATGLKAPVEWRGDHNGEITWTLTPKPSAAVGWISATSTLAWKDTIEKRSYQIRGFPTTDSLVKALMQTPLAGYEQTKWEPTLHGTRFLSLKSGHELQSGRYERGKQEGTWTIHVYQQGVSIQQVYQNGILQREYYRSQADKSPFSGKYYQYYPSGAIKTQIKVKNGRRHGNTKFYDRNGKVSQKVKYKNGLKS